MAEDGLAKALIAVGNQAARSATAEVRGWALDGWALEGAATAALAEAYTALLNPVNDDSVVAVLRANGIPVERLLFEEVGGDRPLVTRADLCELAAAATLIAAEGFAFVDVYMPNIPKGSRRRSESGIDVFAVQLQPSGPPDGLVTGERVMVASVKHTLQADLGALRRALVGSLPSNETSSSLEYLATQLRVIAARIRDRLPEVNTERLYLVLISFPRAPFVSVRAFPAVELTVAAAMSAEADHLPIVEPGTHGMRVLGILNLAELHNLCP